jgi:hypothetical protein
VTQRERHLSGKPRWALEIPYLVHDGFATAHRQTMRVGRRKIQFARIVITDADRKRSKVDVQVRSRFA